ncbi:MAG: sulfatase-like hydrolase/transferase [Sandaracinus sp.]|nr:sulfatase-like hydrolase/transferase [Sandaracinus sp.]
MDLRRPLFAGTILAVAEVIATLLGGWGLFLGAQERTRYLVGALTTCLAVAIVGWGVGALVHVGFVRRAAEPAKALGRLAGVLAVALASVLGWSITSGRRVATASWRELGVVGVAVTVGLLCAALVRWRLTTEGKAKGPRWALVAVLAGSSALAVFADAFVLPRLYPAFHLGAAVAALVAALMASSFASLPAVRGRGRIVLAVVALAFVVASPVALFALDRAPNAAFVARTHASWTGKLLALVPGRGRAPLAATDAPVEAARPARPGIDLRGDDVLLITVDALRADRLGAYGGPEGLTPALDRLAGESVVFRRAYTPTPHTSYALTSLLTGKYMREVMELPGAPSEHAALPDLLREYGYRTAAFYPPAIFFVDASRFAGLAGGGFGFEYRKVMFASAHQRVAQLQRYLEEVAPGHPVFVWVHLFEPHEPYAPPPEFARGDGTVERYEGEVATADDAIGALVAEFRTRRPGGTVILTADHGEELGDHGGWYHGTTLYDEQVRIPLLWSSPGAITPRATDAPVELVDLAPTLLSALGVPRDARMRGDDLGAVLRGRDESAPAFAFASVGSKRMTTDGTHKLICDEGACALFDLAEDARELADRSATSEAVVARFLAAQQRFLESVPRVEAMALADEGGWPSALARAELGDASAAEALVPLLGDARAAVRAAAARALGRLAHAPALPTLARLREDEDPKVAAEAAIAGLSLGDAAATARARDALDAEPEQARRAALALAAHDDAAGASVLRGLAADETAEEGARLEALRALARVRDRGAVPTLVELLADVRLRPVVVGTLAAIGGSRAADAIASAFENERYLAARAAEAEALFVLGDARAEPLTRRFLGMDRPVPGGVRLLQQHRRLNGVSGAGGEVRRIAREGAWSCDDRGCVPGEGATLQLPSARAPREPARAVWRVEGEGTFRVGGVSAPVRGDAEVATPAASDGRYELAGPVRVLAVVVVPASDELPPPPPEPWEQDEDAEGEAEREDAAPAEGGSPEGASPAARATPPAGAPEADG